MKKTRVLSILLALALLCAILAGCGEKAPDASAPADGAGELVYPDSGQIDGAAGDAGAAATLHTTVATCGGKTLDNQLLNYYYWMAYNIFASTYGSSLIDTSTPLAEQYITEGYSLMNYFTLYAIGNWENVMLYLQKAEAEGYEAEGEYADFMASFEETMTSTATDYGFESIDEYLVSYYGEGADYDSYYAYYSDYCTAMSYRAHTQEQFLASHEGESVNTVDVRHILIAPESEETDAWQAALDKANQVYEQWQAVGTEDYFIELAAENSSDGNASTGGLYEGVYPGQMVTAFNDWCFDPARQSGDTGIVSTNYGYHIMYFVETNDEPYADYGTYLANKDMTALEETLAAEFPSEYFSEDAVIYQDFVAAPAASDGADTGSTPETAPQS